jgi:kanamycin kinase
VSAPTDADRSSVWVPAAVEHLATGRPITLVWLNELGARTFAVGAGTPVLFVKWMPTAAEALTGGSNAAERVRLEWAVDYTPVPRLINAGADEDGSWLVTEPLMGESAVSTRWKSEPEVAVRAVAIGLRALHDRLPVEACPFSWSVADRLAGAGVSSADAAERIGEPPPVDRLVVCHGDACMPNTLIGPDGSWSAHVDMGRLGVADRWADIAVGHANIAGNLTPDYQDLFLEAYGVDPDVERMRYYRELNEID